MYIRRNVSPDRAQELPNPTCRGYLKLEVWTLKGARDSLSQVRLGTGFPVRIPRFSGELACLNEWSMYCAAWWSNSRYKHHIHNWK